MDLVESLSPKGVQREGTVVELIDACRGTMDDLVEAYHPTKPQTCLLWAELPEQGPTDSTNYYKAAVLGICPGFAASSPTIHSFYCTLSHHFEPRESITQLEKARLKPYLSQSSTG